MLLSWCGYLSPLLGSGGYDSDYTNIDSSTSAHTLTVTLDYARRRVVMSGYRVLYLSTASGQVLGELPVSKFGFTESLNEPGSFEASMPLETALGGRLAGSVGRPELSASDFAPDGRTTVVVVSDGVPVWAGLLWGMHADLASGSLMVSGSGLLSYFGRRLITEDTSFDTTEQTEIAWSLIDTAQSVGGSMGITDASSATGVLRDRTYLRFDAITVLRALQNLAAVNNGFDFRVGLSWSGGLLVRSFETSYPQSGRSTAIVLDAAYNLADVAVKMDGSKVNTVAYADGAPGSTRQAVTNAALEAAIPRLETVASFPSVQEESTLLGHAETISQRGSETVKVLKATLGRDTEPQVGGPVVGDNIEVRGSLGWLDLAGQYRIGAYSVRVDEQGGENVSLSLASEGAYS